MAKRSKKTKRAARTKHAVKPAAKRRGSKRPAKRAKAVQARAKTRAESFNLMNRVQFGLPNQILSSGQIGVVSSQANSPRQVQFGLKILF